MQKLLRAWDVASFLLRAAGVVRARQLRAASTALARLVDDVAFAFPIWFPQRIYALGGDSDRSANAAGNTAEVLDLACGAWEPLPPMSLARSGAVAVAARGFVYVLGGRNGAEDGAALAACERYCSESRRWEPLPDMRAARSTAAAAALGGDVLVVGGQGGPAGAALRSVERLVECAEAWEPGPELHLARAGATALVFGRELFAIGGWDQVASHRSIERLDAARGAWHLEALPEFAASPRLCAAVALAGLGGTLLVSAGGHAEGDDGRQALSSAECLRATAAGATPAAECAWAPLCPLLGPRLRAAAASAAGEVYVLGGSSGGRALSSVERWDPAVGRWEVAPQMMVARDAPAACVARF